MGGRYVIVTSNWKWGKKLYSDTGMNAELKLEFWGRPIRCGRAVRMAQVHTAKNNETKVKENYHPYFLY